MNYLAHLYLAGHTPESLIGNLAGDFVKGPLGERFPPAIADGIRQHRRIDAFTDEHPSVAAFRRILIPDHGHYARIIADVFFDHFLACDFEEWGGEPLEAFIDRVYAAIDPHTDLLPGHLRFVYPMMRDQRWLLSYRDIGGIRMSLGGISQRLSRHPDLAPAVRHLTGSRAALEPHFRAFFPDVVAFARKVHSAA